MNGYTFREDIFVKIVLTPFWEGIYPKKIEGQNSSLFLREDSFKEALRKHAYSNI